VTTRPPVISNVVRVWGEPVRLAGGRLTHWAGAARGGARLLAHGDYAWTGSIREPVPGAAACVRCERRQPAFVTCDMNDPAASPDTNGDQP
jgi:hypothetical protein